MSAPCEAPAFGRCVAARPASTVRTLWLHSVEAEAPVGWSVLSDELAEACPFG
jgi:hypothetical protein